MQFYKLFLIICLALCNTPAFGQYFDSLYSHPAQAGVLQGQPLSFVVTGYSTSHWPSNNPWPDILQQMLIDHAGNDSTYFVFRHTVSGTPIAKWTDICANSNQHVNEALNRYVNPGTQVPVAAPNATIMLAQQSLQWAFGNCQDRFIGIEGPNDLARIEQGAHAITYYAEQFLNGGIQRVYLATHIYKTGNYPLNLCGEEYAMRRALDSLPGLVAGPELCAITQSLFPDGFAADQVHPGPEVAHAMALYWYLVLAGEGANLDIAQGIADTAGIDLPEGMMTALDEKKNEYPLKLYPNPAEHTLVIHYDGPIHSPLELEVWDLMGKPYLKSHLVQNHQTLALSNWPAGLYILRLTGETGPQSIPFLKQ